MVPGSAILLFLSKSRLKNYFTKILLNIFNPTAQAYIYDTLGRSGYSGMIGRMQYLIKII